MKFNIYFYEYMVAFGSIIQKFNDLILTKYLFYNFNLNLSLSSNIPVLNICPIVNNNQKYIKSHRMIFLALKTKITIIVYFRAQFR